MRTRTPSDWPTLFPVDDYLVTEETVAAARWPCKRCTGMVLRPDPPIPGLPYWGADPCLGWLPNVAHACCGHGKDADAYVVISAGCFPSQPASDLPEAVTLRAEDAIRHFRSLGVGPPAKTPDGNDRDTTGGTK